LQGFLLLWIFTVFAGIIADIFINNILFINFSIGAVFAIIAYMLGFPIGFQVIIFLLMGNSLFAVTYFYIRKRFKNIPQVSPYEKTFIGKTFKLNKDLDLEGQVMFNGIYWIAVSDEPLKKGDIVVIKAIKGNKIIIKKKE